MNSVIKRIFDEKPIISDELFHIVSDKNPICPEHYLILPRKGCSSLANLSLDMKVYLNNLLRTSFSSTEYAFFERGNVNFCTSVNTPAYAHGHVVNIKYFNKSIMGNLLQNQCSTETDSILSGLNLINSEKEYLLAGIISDSCNVVSPFNSTIKRYVRSILLENVTHEAIH